MKHYRLNGRGMFHNGIYAISKLSFHQAFIAQLGERQTEDLEVSSSILLEGTFILYFFSYQ